MAASNFDRRLEKLEGPKARIDEKTIFNIVVGWFNNDIFAHLAEGSEWRPGQPKYSALKAWYDQKLASAPA